MSKTVALAATFLMLAVFFSGCIVPDEPAAVGDDTPPVIRLISPSNDSFIRPGQQISLSIEDENLSSVMYSVDGSPMQDIYYPFQISTDSWGEGLHRLRLTAYDDAWNNASALYVFHIDLTPPRISLIFPSNGSVIDSSALIKLSVDDENFRSANYTLDGGGPRILTYPFVISVKWWSEGPHRIKVNANDMAWNRGSAEFHFTIDNRPTDIVLVSPDSRVIRPGVPIVFEIDEENLANITCTVNGMPVDFTDHTIDTDGWADGVYSIEINASDAAGHRMTRSYIFEVDSRPPEIISDISNREEVDMVAKLNYMDITFTHSGGRLNISATDQHLFSVLYSINGGKYRSLEGPIDIYGIRGSEARISVFAVDMAGNSAYLNLTVFPHYTITVQMGDGNSELGFPLQMNDTYIRTVLNSINGSYSKALTYRNGSWSSFNPEYPDKYNLDFLHIEMDMGVVIKVNRSRANLTTSGYLPDTYTTHLRKGSNFVPYLSMIPMRLDRAFAHVPWYRVQRWDWEKGEYVDMRGNETLLPGHAYWVYTSEECIITYDF